MTTQVRLPCSARRCIVGSGILTHTVTGFNQGGFIMRHRVFSFALLTLISFAFISSHAQTPDAAVENFKEGLKKSDRGDYDGAIEAFSRAIALSSRLDTRKQSLTSQASSFSGASVPTAADVVAENVKVIDPFTADAYNNRGFARYRKGDYLDAIEDFSAALRIRPALFIAYLNRAAALQAKGDSESAMKDLDKAVSIKKDFYQAYINRGSLFHDLGHDKEALSDLNHAIELKNDVAEAFFQRGYVQLALNNWDQSIKDFDRALELMPTMGWAYQGRGIVLMKKGQMERAIKDFNRAIEYSPDLVWAYFNRGLAQLYLGHEELAQHDFDICLKLKPDVKKELDDKIGLARHLRNTRKE